jgi:hypothetical protein
MTYTTRCLDRGTSRLTLACLRVLRAPPHHGDNAVLSAPSGSGIRSPAAGWTLAGVMHPLHLANLQAAAAGVHRAAATSGFTLADILGIVTVLIVPIGVVVLALLARRRDPRDDGDGDSGWGRGGPGGWGRGGPGGPPWLDDGPRLPNGDPAWWPEFERQFAAYVGQEVGRFAPSRRSRSIRASTTDGQTLSDPR